MLLNLVLTNSWLICLVSNVFCLVLFACYTIFTDVLTESVGLIQATLSYPETREMHFLILNASHLFQLCEVKGTFERNSILFKKESWEKEMATHSSVLAWRIPGTGEPGGLPSVGSHRVGHDWSDLAAAAAAAFWYRDDNALVNSELFKRKWIQFAILIFHVVFNLRILCT